VTPAGPPPDYYRRRRSILWPVILIGLGVAFLLQNFGLLSWQNIGALWQYWPALLILVGLELFVNGHRRGSFLGAVVILALIGGGIYAATHAANPLTGRFRPPFAASNNGPSVSRDIAQPLQGASQASVSLQFGAGDVSIGSLQGQPDDLAVLNYNGPDQLAPRPVYNVSNGIGQLTFQAASPNRGPAPPFLGGGNSNVDVLLNPAVPINLAIQEGASTSRFDLSGLRVANLTLETGASTTSLTMPANGTTTAMIKGGAATIDVTVPPGVGAQVQFQGGLSSVKVDTSRFPQASDGAYRSADWDSAQNKIDLTVQAGVATVSIH